MEISCKYVPKREKYIVISMINRLIEHREYITRHGEDMPEVRDWTWPC